MLVRHAALRRLIPTVAALWALGAVLGLVWQWWSPPGPAGFQISPGVIQPDETEAFIAADGRFAILALAVGLLAALAAWFGPVRRGSLTVIALTVGGLGGSAAMDAVGHATRAVGRDYACGTGASRCVDHLPLVVHAHGLLLLQAATAVFVYGLCVAFARRDDLGVVDDVLVGADVEPQHPGCHGDGPGETKQGDLAP